MNIYVRFVLCASLLGLLSSCQSTNIKNLVIKSVPFIKSSNQESTKPSAQVAVSGASITKLLDEKFVEVKVDQGFKQSVKDAVNHDPEVLALENQYTASRIAIDIATSQKDFNVSSSLYGGVEDLTDETTGIALVMDARRLIYDGGQLDNQISSESLKSQSLNYALTNKKNETALKAAGAWVELRRYTELSELIDSRLRVLEPLIGQLETVADAGIGDVSQVAAAQRTVAMIRITETDLLGKLDQAKVNFQNINNKILPPVPLKKSLIPIIVAVAAGSSIPIPSYIFANTGTTLISMNTLTVIATVNIILGYIKADLIFFLIPSFFSNDSTIFNKNTSSLPLASPALIKFT